MLLENKLLKNEIENEISNLLKEKELSECNFYIIVNELEDSKKYAEIKKRYFEKHGLNIISIINSDDMNSIDKICEKINQNPSKNKFMIQYPNKHTDEIRNKINNDILPLVDVDRMFIEDHLPHPTVSSIMRFINYGIKLNENTEINDYKVLIIGRSKFLGKKVLEKCLDDNFSVSVVHSKTNEDILNQYIYESDIIISCSRNLDLDIKYGHIIKNHKNKKKIFIDASINIKNGKVFGCFYYPQNFIDQDLIHITPVPGGIGPITVSELLLNYLKLI